MSTIFSSRAQEGGRGTGREVFRPGATAMTRLCLLMLSLLLLGLPGAADAQQASHYSDKFHGRRTASGERYDRGKLTAASPSLPLGSRVKVTNKWTGKSVYVTINDRSRRMKGRQIDLSRAAAKRIGLTSGTAPVRIERVGR